LATRWIKGRLLRSSCLSIRLLTPDPVGVSGRLHFDLASKLYKVVFQALAKAEGGSVFEKRGLADEVNLKV